MTKSEFVRANPGVKAKALVALAAEQGITLTAGYVSQIRYNDTKRGKTTRKRLSKSEEKRIAVLGKSPDISGGVSAQALTDLRALILRLGTEQALPVVQEFFYAKQLGT